MKEYIITGATGYLGFVLVNKLIEEGYFPLKIISRSENNLKRFKYLPVKSLIGDINDEVFLNKIITKNSVVFHLAGYVSVSSVKRKQIFKTNVDASLKLINICIDKQVEKFIYTSSVAAIIPPKEPEIIKEPTYFNPKKVTGDYAKTKAITTEYILNKSKEGLLNAVVIYPSAIIGPYDYNISNLGQVVIDYMNKKLTAYTKGKYNFVDVRDVADSLIQAYKHGKNGQDYLITGQTLNLDEMFLTINKIIKRDKLPHKLPLWFVKAVASLAELHYLIRRKKPVLSRTSIKILNQNSNFDYSKAKKDLNFNPRPALESFEDMINWFYKNKTNLIKK